MKITLQVGEKTNLSMEGYSFYVRDSIGPIKVQFKHIGTGFSEVQELQEGQGLKGNERFETVEIENTHSTEQTIDFLIGVMEFVDNRDTGLVTVDGLVDVAVGTLAVDLADTILVPSGGKVIDANPDRIEVHLYCDQPVKWGGLGQWAGSGVRIPAKTPTVLSLSGDIKIRNVGSISCKLEMTEVLK